jgi:hypothetical protein
MEVKLMQELLTKLKSIVGIQEGELVTPIIANLRKNELLAIQNNILFYLHAKDDIDIVDIYEYKETMPKLEE